jgi:hypothetical protein
MILFKKISEIFLVLILHHEDFQLEQFMEDDCLRWAHITLKLIVEGHASFVEHVEHL